MSKPMESLETLFIKKPYNCSINTLGLGVFDGLHRGHESIAKHCDGLMTFYPHPDLVLGRIKTSTYITTLDELNTLFSNLIVLRFTKKIASLSPKSFLEDIVMTCFSPKKIVVGYDYHFGYKGQGDTNYLNDWGLQNGVEIQVVEPVSHNGKLVKSGLIRQCIQLGAFNDAVDFLGHPYLICGEVVKGKGIGRTIGFPTANLKVPTEKLLPNHGVYKGTTEIDGKRYLVAVHIGSKPTFKDQTSSVEAHVLGFSQDIYGQTLMLSLESKIRDIKAFPSKEALVEQIHKDLEVVHER